MIKPGRRHCLKLCSALAVMAAWPSFSVATELAGVPDARVVGKGRYSYLGLKVFDATLYAPLGRFDPKKPFALRLDYLRPLKGAQIADRSIDEIRKQGFRDTQTLEGWRKILTSLFPDVSPGSNLTGVRDLRGATQFFHNGQALGTVDDPLFSRHFFDIWLGQTSSSKTLRAQLLGQA